VYEFLITCGCDEIQGYFFSPPLMPSALEVWLQNRSKEATPSHNPFGISADEDSGNSVPICKSLVS